MAETPQSAALRFAERHGWRALLIIGLVSFIGYLLVEEIAEVISLERDILAVEQVIEQGIIDLGDNQERRFDRHEELLEAILRFQRATCYAAANGSPADQRRCEEADQ